MTSNKDSEPPRCLEVLPCPLNLRQKPVVSLKQEPCSVFLLPADELAAGAGSGPLMPQCGSINHHLKTPGVQHVVW